MSKNGMPAADNKATPSRVLKSFLDINKDAQRVVAEQVRVATDPQSALTDRRSAEAAIVTALALAPADVNGQVLGEGERLSPDARAVRTRMEQREIFFVSAVSHLLAEKQMTQTDLAAAVGVSQPAISLILSRRCRPHRRTIGRIAAALKVNVEDLWPEEARADR